MKTEKYITTPEEIERAYKAHDKDTCQVDCCIFCFMDRKEELLECERIVNELSKQIRGEPEMAVILDDSWE